MVPIRLANRTWAGELIDLWAELEVTPGWYLNYNVRMIIALAIGLGALGLALTISRQWITMHSRDMGTMSRQWVVEQNAQHPMD